MRIAYRKTILIFFILAIAPIAVLGFFVNKRIQQRQLAMQLFLQNQVDIDRKILTVRETLRGVQPKVRRATLTARDVAEQKNTIASIKDDRETISKFWKRYQENYTASQRPFLLQILVEGQESNLVEEEERTLGDIQKLTEVYFAFIFNHPVFRGAANIGDDQNLSFLDEAEGYRVAVYGSINQLADLRYIFSQRTIFFLSGENAAQQGVFRTIFVTIMFVIFVVAVVQYFILLRPLGDIMLFLSDLSQGKRGQRLYFSSPVKEIKQSEDIINKFVDSSEKHEEHERKT